MSSLYKLLTNYDSSNYEYSEDAILKSIKFPKKMLELIHNKKLKFINNKKKFYVVISGVCKDHTIDMISNMTPCYDHDIKDSLNCNKIYFIPSINSQDMQLLGNEALDCDIIDLNYDGEYMWILSLKKLDNIAGHQPNICKNVENPFDVEIYCYGIRLYESEQ